MSSYKIGHEVFISKMEDVIKHFQTQNRSYMTYFLTIPEQNILKAMLPKNMNVYFDGGYNNAERKIACFISDYDDFYSDCVCLHAHYSSKFKKIKHSDILGSLLHTGIDRNVLGDLIVQDDDIYVFCKDRIAQYLIDNCTFIAKIHVQFNYCLDFKIQKKNTQPITILSSSLRLDSIVAQLAHCSRSEAMKKIHAGLVKVNDVVLEQNVQLCNNDFVSIRKTGRFHFVDVVSNTKKGRLVLLFDQYV